MNNFPNSATAGWDGSTCTSTGFLEALTQKGLCDMAVTQDGPIWYNEDLPKPCQFQQEMSERKNEAGPARHVHSAPAAAASFPTHNSPRTWFLTSSLTPLAIRLIRQLLNHGDYVVACLPPHEIENDERSAEFRELIYECKSNRKDREGWKDRIRSIRCDGRIMGQCGAAVAEAKEHFGRIDILLCCTSEAVVGTVEELSTSPATQNLGARPI
ncbi:NAD(P)-binding protein [Apiospora arundinis]